jgi:hypothetical protein
MTEKNTIRDDVGRIIKGLPNALNKPKITKFELDSYMLSFD